MCFNFFSTLFYPILFEKKMPVTTHKLDFTIHYWISIYSVKNTNLDPVSHTCRNLYSHPSDGQHPLECPR